MASKRLGDPESFNRVFILGAKDLREEELKAEFDRYGLVKDVYFVKDRRTNERKDVAYVTYSKASEAALAIEEMNGKSLADGARPLKVILANSRSEGSVRDANEDAKMMRLFIVVPDGFSENDVQEDFSKFGDVDSVRFLKDRATGRNKSLAYVNFKRAYHAALALEGCDAHYKPVFATAPGNKSSDDRRREPEPHRRDDRSLSRDRERRGSSYSLPPPPSSRSASSSSMSHDVLDMIRNYPSHGETILEAMIPGGLSYDQTCKLFDLVPGLEKFNYDPSSGIAHIKYSIPQLASYARDKFDGLEYPPGCHVLVQYYNKPTRRYEPPGSDYGSSINNSILAMRRGIQATEQDPNGPGAIKSLVDTIQKAMLLLQQTGLPPSATANMAWALKGLDRERYNESSYGGGGGGGGGGLGDNGGDARYCSVPLPDRQPMAPASSDVAQRLFIVSVPEAFPQSFLEDCFCRFGHLITAFFMPGRNCGYVKYASMDSARRAVNTLHMQTVCGNTLKVMVAEEPPPSSKRHYDDDGHSGSPAGKHSRVM